MALGFGSNGSVGADDNSKLALTPVATPQTLSVACFFKYYQQSTYPRIFELDHSGTTTRLHYHDDSGGWLYARSDGSSTIAWTFTAPSTSATHSIVVTHDSSSGNSTPIVYVDGSPVSVTGDPMANTGTTGTPASAIVGNRSAADRPFQGWIERFTLWNVILTSGEVTSFHSGTATSSIQGASRIYSADLLSTYTESIQGGAVYTGSTGPNTPVYSGSPLAPNPGGTLSILEHRGYTTF